MGTRKTGSRRIVVEGVAYRWRVRRRATNSQADYGSGTLHVAVELDERPGSTLVLFTDRPHPQDWATKSPVSITPADVAGCVRQALLAGWDPAGSGPQFLFQVSGKAANPTAE